MSTTSSAAIAEYSWQRSSQIAPTPLRAVSAPRVMQMMLKQLRAEAATAREAARFEHASPDFATRFTAEHPDVAPPLEDILEAIVARQDRDSFTDAYVRWQLTSFEVQWPQLDERSFFSLINNAPPMVENPRAALNVVATIEQAEKAGPMPPETVERIRQAMADLADQEVIATEMNRPAAEWRDWVAAHLGDTGIMPRLWLVERLRAMLVAGWSVSSVKGNLTRNFTDSIDDETFTHRDRQIVIEHLRQLKPIERDYVGEITYFANGRIDAVIHGVYVSNTNVETWHKRLLGIPD